MSSLSDTDQSSSENEENERCRLLCPLCENDENTQPSVLSSITELQAHFSLQHWQVHGYACQFCGLMFGTKEELLTSHTDCQAFVSWSEERKKDLPSDERLPMTHARMLLCCSECGWYDVIVNHRDATELAGLRAFFTQHHNDGLLPLIVYFADEPEAELAIRVPVTSMIGGDPLTPCDHCPPSVYFRDPAEANIHYMQLHKDKLLACTECPAQTTTQYLLNQHLMSFFADFLTNSARVMPPPSLMNAMPRCGWKNRATGEANAVGGIVGGAGAPPTIKEEVYELVSLTEDVAVAKVRLADKRIEEGNIAGVAGFENVVAPKESEMAQEVRQKLMRKYADVEFVKAFNDLTWLRDDVAEFFQQWMDDWESPEGRRAGGPPKEVEIDAPRQKADLCLHYFSRGSSRRRPLGQRLLPFIERSPSPSPSPPRKQGFRMREDEESVGSREKTVQCRHFARGFCERGDSCSFLHDPAAVNEDSERVPNHQKQSSPAAAASESNTSLKAKSVAISAAIGQWKSEKARILEEQSLVAQRQKTVPCPSFLKGRCPLGEDECFYSHEKLNRVCGYFARDLCDLGSKCPLLHEKPKDLPEAEATPAIAPAPRKKMDLCLYYLSRGSCKHGDKCPYLHEKLNEICPFLSLCQRGNKCAYILHELPKDPPEAEAAPAIAPTPRQKIGLCLHYFSRGSCKYGSDCVYLHENLQEPCPYVVCLRGNKCPYQHEKLKDPQGTWGAPSVTAGAATVAAVLGFAATAASEGAVGEVNPRQKMELCYFYSTQGHYERGQVQAMYKQKYDLNDTETGVTHLSSTPVQLYMKGIKCIIRRETIPDENGERSDSWVYDATEAWCRRREIDCHQKVVVYLTQVIVVDRHGVAIPSLHTVIYNLDKFGVSLSGAANDIAAQFGCTSWMRIPSEVILDVNAKEAVILWIPTHWPLISTHDIIDGEERNCM